MIIVLLPLLPALRLRKAFRRDVIKPLVVDAQLATIRPEITAVSNDAHIKRVRRLSCAGQPVHSAPLREPIEPEEVHQEAAAAPRTWTSVGVAVMGPSGRAGRRCAVLDSVHPTLVMVLPVVPHLPR